MNRPFVSVIIPNYNHSQYLDQRIQSVLNQTYKNFEVIILDDKSSDNSEEVINKYRSNPHVTHVVFNEFNSGSTFIQWNRGFQLAEGEIIWIAESDDYCDSYFLEILVEAYCSSPGCVVAYSSSQYVDSYGSYLHTEGHEDEKTYDYEGAKFIQQKLAYGCAIWNASSAIFSKSIALSLDQQYQDYKACGDRLFWIFMSEKGNVVHVNRRLNYFRQHLNKVSPKRQLDGTSLHEEYEINEFLCERNYIKGARRLFILSLYLRKINECDFLNENIRQELMQLWGFDKKTRTVTINMISRLYIYYHLYILCRKPL